MERRVHHVTTVSDSSLALKTSRILWSESLESPLEVTVVFTDMQSSLNALKTAAFLAGGLNARVRLVVPQVVSYELPLNEPPIPTDFIEQQIGHLVSDLNAEIRVDICLCRNRKESLLRTLRPQSLTVVGGRRRWWPTWESRLARDLRRGGHEVIFTETE
ncbi:MAG TPA: hypothetical protein VMW38_02815 [Terriglobia bacterium]|nr:hypothetical protein [Terriglobia bacterium]